MKKVLTSILLVMSLFSTGCFSCYKTYSHNMAVESQIVQVRAFETGDTDVKINLLGLSKGYFGAWSENPSGMALATGGDILTGILTYYVVEDRLDIELSIKTKDDDPVVVPTE